MPKRNHVDTEVPSEMRSASAPPRKKARNNNVFSAGSSGHHAPSLGGTKVKREDESERRESGDERDGNDRRDACVDSRTARAPVAAAITTRVAPAKGIILRSGRIRLPDKLIQYLNNEVAPEALFWQSDGQGFSIDCEKVQADLLDNYFHGTKLSSFLRSLNRWGFKRLFYHSMPKTTLSFHHPLFRKDAVDLCKDMNMGPCAASAGSGTVATEVKHDSKPAPVAQVERIPAASLPPSQVSSIPAVATAPSLATQPQQNQIATLTLPAIGNAHILQAVIEQMRAEVAAEAARKDLLLRQALAAAQQRSAVVSQANNNGNSANPLELLESVLSSLAPAGQPSANPNDQLVALARALAAPTAASPPPAPVPAPAPQAPSAGALLQLLTPAQQLELLNQLTSSN